MSVDIVTREDLQVFRIQLLHDLKGLLASVVPATEDRWLKNKEVCQLMKISPMTVQRLRISGKLKSSKVGGVHYYRYRDVQALLESGFKLVS